MTASAVARSRRAAPRARGHAAGAALAMAVLCVSAGVHAALAVLHAGASGGGDAAVGFALAALAAAACWLSLRVGVRGAAGASAWLLASMAAAYVASRVTALPLVGEGSWDALGVVTSALELVAALVLRRIADEAESPAPIRAPAVICALIVAYSFLAAFAIPSDHTAAGHHHSMHGGGHQHASG